MASKMTSKEYTSVRCGHCGKFGHHHDSHDFSAKDERHQFNKAAEAKSRLHTSQNSLVSFPKREIRKRFNESAHQDAMLHTVKFRRNLK